MDEEQIRIIIAEEIQKVFGVLENSTTIPFEVDSAFRDRLNVTITDSEKAVADVTQAVDEGGSATYNVSKIPDGFIRINGKNVPYLND